MGLSFRENSSNVTQCLVFQNKVNYISLLKEVDLVEELLYSKRQRINITNS